MCLPESPQGAGLPPRAGLTPCSQPDYCPRFPAPQGARCTKAPTPCQEPGSCPEVPDSTPGAWAPPSEPDCCLGSLAASRLPIRHWEPGCTEDPHMEPDCCPKALLFPLPTALRHPALWALGSPPGAWQPPVSPLGSQLPTGWLPCSQQGARSLRAAPRLLAGIGNRELRANWAPSSLSAPHTAALRSVEDLVRTCTTDRRAV